MKIAMSDCCRGKFSNVIANHWRDKGHQVIQNVYWEPNNCKDVDVIFFDWADNSVQRASNPEDEFYKKFNVPYLNDKNIILRCHDIDMWTGGLGGVKPNFVKHIVFVAEHIRRKAKVLEGAEVHVIKHGIDTDKFTLRKSKQNKNIAWIGRFDANKDPRLALQVIQMLPRDYTLHILGTGPKARWQEAYWEEFIRLNDLSVTFTDRVDDVNEWLEDKSYLLHTAQKEAFGYVIGEAMAKGIKPVIHRFYGAGEVWTEEYVWDGVAQAVNMILSQEYEPDKYREFIMGIYPLSKMLEEYDKLL